MKFIIRGPENEHIIKNWPLQSLQPWPLITEYLSRRIHWVRSTIIAIPTFWKVATLETVHWYIPKTRDRTQQGTTQIFCFFGNGTPQFSSISHIFGIKNHHSLEYPPVFRPKSSPFSGPLAEPKASCRRRWDCKGWLGSTEGKPLGNMAWGGKLRCWVWGWLDPKVPTWGIIKNGLAPLIIIMRCKMGICDGFGDGLFFGIYHMILKHAFSMIFLEVGAAQRNKDGSQSSTEMHLAKALVFRFFGGFWPASDLWGGANLLVATSIDYPDPLRFPTLSRHYPCERREIHPVLWNKLRPCSPGSFSSL